MTINGIMNKDNIYESISINENQKVIFTGQFNSGKS